MKNLQINEQNARTLFKTASPEFRQTLIDTFGIEFFSDKITDRVKTFEDACDVVGNIPSNIKILLSYNGIDKDMLAAQAFAKLTIISKALNEKWKADYNDSNQRKWYPWFKWSGSGFFGYGLRLCDFGRRFASLLCHFRAGRICRKTVRVNIQ